MIAIAHPSGTSVAFDDDGNITIRLPKSPAAQRARHDAHTVTHLGAGHDRSVIARRVEEMIIGAGYQTHTPGQPWPGELARNIVDYVRRFA